MMRTYLRKADYLDIDLLYRWANDPVFRCNSFNTAPIPYDNHIKWFNKIMEDESVLLFIMMEDETPVGQIRLNIDGYEAEIGYSIAEEYRGKGYGSKMIQLLVEKVSSNYPQIKKLVVKVKPNNDSSITIFEKERYQHLYNCYTLEVNHRK